MARRVSAPSRWLQTRRLLAVTFATLTLVAVSFLATVQYFNRIHTVILDGVEETTGAFIGSSNLRRSLVQLELDIRDLMESVLRSPALLQSERRRLLADSNHDTAEFAAIVSDPWQGRGIGRLLLDHCLNLARRWGIRSVVAETDPKNRAMLALLKDRGFATELSFEDDAVYLQKTLGPGDEAAADGPAGRSGQGPGAARLSPSGRGRSS